MSCGRQGLTLPVSRLRLMNPPTVLKSKLYNWQLLRAYARIQSPQRRVHAGHPSMASPFMTGPPVPVGILNPIRAFLGIPPDSTFPENALGGGWWADHLNPTASGDCWCGVRNC